MRGAATNPNPILDAQARRRAAPRGDILLQQLLRGQLLHRLVGLLLTLSLTIDAQAQRRRAPRGDVLLQQLLRGQLLHRLVAQLALRGRAPSQREKAGRQRPLV